jgi:hypothetical protein
MYHSHAQCGDEAVKQDAELQEQLDFGLHWVSGV